MKIGDKVKCIQPGSSNGKLEKDAIYEVNDILVDGLDPKIRLTNVGFDDCYWWESRFELCPSKREQARHALECLLYRTEPNDDRVDAVLDKIEAIYS